MPTIENITVGCSHNWGWRLEEEDIWFNILKKKAGISFYNRSTPGAGLSYLVAKTKQLISKNLFHPKDIKHVVLQKPQSIRCPWWGADGTGYRYTNGLGGSIKAREGHLLSIKKYKELTDDEKRIVANNICRIEERLLHEFVTLFPNAKYLYFHYWGDHIMDLIHRPLLAEVNLELEKMAEQLKMTNAGMIVDLKNIKGLYDKDGDLNPDGKVLTKENWWVGHQNWHPGTRFHKLVAETVEGWINGT